VEAFLLERAVAWKGRDRFAWTRVLTIVGALTLWGALDEAHQEWIPGRQMDADDLAADVAGALTGSVLAGSFQPRRPLRDRRLKEFKPELFLIF
jgi:VanZ family protein